MKSKTLVLFALLCLFLPITSFARDYLGSASFSSYYGFETIFVSDCEDGEPVVSEAKLEILFGPTYINNIEFRFADGTMERFRPDGNFPANYETRWESLGEARCLETIVFQGQSIGRYSSRSTVRVWGRD